MNKNEIISIIMPSYNSMLYIDRAIQSILKQTFSNWELIIIDDCSTDSTIRIINKYIQTNENIILLENEKNLGPALSRNLGINRMNGSFLTFLDSDDFWDNTYLDVMYNYLNNNNLNWVVSSYKRVTSNGDYINSFYVPKILTKNSMLKSCPIAPICVMINVSILGKEYFTNIKREDITLWLKYFEKEEYITGIDDCLANYTIHNNSRSSNKILMIKQQWEIYRSFLKMNVVKSLYYIFFWAINGLKKYSGTFIKMNRTKLK